MAPRLKAANNAKTTLTSSISAGDTTFQVDDSSAFPDEGPFRITIDAEVMEVGTINKATNTFSNVQRGIENTLASTHDEGAEVFQRFTAGMYEELADEAAVNARIDAHKEADPIDHPDGSITLAKISEEAMTGPGGTEAERLAQTNSSGRVGDSERLGGVYAADYALITRMNYTGTGGSNVRTISFEVDERFFPLYAFVAPEGSPWRVYHVYSFGAIFIEHDSVGVSAYPRLTTSGLQVRNEDGNASGTTWHVVAFGAPLVSTS